MKSIRLDMRILWDVGVCAERDRLALEAIFAASAAT
jgi:hypothetical protein